MSACSRVLAPSMPRAIDVVNTTPSQSHFNVVRSSSRPSKPSRSPCRQASSQSTATARGSNSTRGLFKLAPCDMKSSNIAAASLIVSHRELSTDVSVTWSNNSSQNSGMPSKSVSRPRNMRISQFPMEASDTDGFETSTGIDASLALAISSLVSSASDVLFIAILEMQKCTVSAERKNFGSLKSPRGTIL